MPKGRARSAFLTAFACWLVLLASGDDFNFARAILPSIPMSEDLLPLDGPNTDFTESAQSTRVFVADFARGRSTSLFRRRGAGVGALPRVLDFNTCHGIPLCLYVRAVVCSPMVTATFPAHRRSDDPRGNAQQGDWFLGLATGRTAMFRSLFWALWPCQATPREARRRATSRPAPGQWPGGRRSPAARRAAPSLHLEQLDIHPPGRYSKRHSSSGGSCFGKRPVPMLPSTPTSEDLLPLDDPNTDFTESANPRVYSWRTSRVGGAPAFSGGVAPASALSRGFPMRGLLGGKTSRPPLQQRIDTANPQRTTRRRLAYPFSINEK
jgi:hypothetical protein